MSAAHRNELAQNSEYVPRQERNWHQSCPDAKQPSDLKNQAAVSVNAWSAQLEQVILGLGLSGCQSHYRFCDVFNECRLEAGIAVTEQRI